jgi:hypothetical protein
MEEAWVVTTKAKPRKLVKAVGAEYISFRKIDNALVFFSQEDAEAYRLKFVTPIRNALESVQIYVSFSKRERRKHV